MKNVIDSHTSKKTSHTSFTDFKICRKLHYIPIKGAGKFMMFTSSNLNRFLKFFLRWKGNNIYNKTILFTTS